MAYYPYFRGKQFELLAVKEKAELIADAKVTPIIEPVRESLAGLERALDALQRSGANAVVILNPNFGDHSEDSGAIVEIMREKYIGFGFLPGLLLGENLHPGDVPRLLDEIDSPEIALIHAGFDDDAVVNGEIAQRQLRVCNIFIDRSTGLLYQQRFQQTPRVLVSDGLVQRKNSLYPHVERFSDLHATYTVSGFDGFGDFSIVGNNYSDSGGPAWAVAIHITCAVSYTHLTLPTKA